MPANFIERYAVEPEDWYEAGQWTAKAARRLGLTYDKQISALTIYSSEELWVGGEEEDMTLNPDTVTLTFNLGSHWREPYLRKIEFDAGRGKEEALPIPSVEWRVGETSGDPPASLEELIRAGDNPRLRERAKDFPAFFELYTGIFERLFPQVEHAGLHTDVRGYDEASSSALKKELWRTDLLTRLQGLRFPPMEIEAGVFPAMGRQVEGCRVSWQPQGHTNYQIWFNLYVGEDPKLCVYCDPTLSGSTQGWLSTRLIKNEHALEKLPYTLEQWAVEDARKKDIHPGYRKAIRELLLHHLPRELEEAWAALRRQLIGVRHGELHTDVSSYDEALVKRLTEAAPAPSFSPEDFEKVVHWAETTGGAVKAEIEEEDWGKIYRIWLNRGGKVSKITVPGKGGRKYIFHLELMLDIEVPLVSPLKVSYTAYIMHGDSSVGTAYSSANKTFLPTLKEVRENLGFYSQLSRSKLAQYSRRAYNAVKATDKFFFQKLDALYRDAIDLLTPVPEHHELHTDTSGYDEAFLAVGRAIVKG